MQEGTHFCTIPAAPQKVEIYKIHQGMRKRKRLIHRISLLIPALFAVLILLPAAGVTAYAAGGTGQTEP